jgi:hypothetical protein
MTTSRAASEADAIEDALALKASRADATAEV